MSAIKDILFPGHDSDVPEAIIPQGVDAGTRQATQAAYDRAQGATPESEHSLAMEGVNRSGQDFMPKGDALNKRNNALGMLSPDGLSQAISNRMNRKYDSDINKISRQSKLNSYKGVADRNTAAFDPLLANQAFDYEVYKRQMENYNNKVAARNEQISNILGLGGSVFGAVLGQTPNGRG